MYTPKHFKVEDRDMVIPFMQQFPFALLVTVKDGVPRGTHLPFVLEERESDLMIISHMALANEQWYDFKDENLCMVVFSEPHAYVSTSFYGKSDKVPTWNYAAIHVYGKPVILESDREKMRVLENMINTFYAPDMDDYKALNDTYLQKMLKGIVAFEIKAERMEGKFKMSQNRKEEEKIKIISAFENSGDTMKKSVAEIMKKVNKT